MNFPELHGWDLSATEAVALQRELAQRVDLTPRLGDCRILAGADISYNKFSTTLYATIVVIAWPSGDVLETQDVVAEQTFPYIPGLLSFRELPPFLTAFRRLQTVPDVVICDGQGIAHPRRFGVAAHLGMWLGIPTIGCGKSRLCGTFTPPDLPRGSTSPLMDHDQRIGTVVRTRTGINPLFVSPGHAVSHEQAVEVVLMASPKYRLPETTRLADHRVNLLRQQANAAAAESPAYPDADSSENLLNSDTPEAD
ncbi:deoxyribonuclease V [Tuwongella immobilis]|uniref:Endonuclease V n=1 Tax=Tuwongella immobilis TaxID=692036 RepID=A0A6C2YM57_9BACT|nr:deoxyribonuclease V [Tuwongella immobilis]VIP02516.1 endonuclease v : Endonuclease V OS=Paenibacillus sp. MSt1 GN=nfi PE=3 SV=1: Endonuclease_5 [Tuwongella immobilis]VTS01637.1 endonuclease v : Endonuclease V OS=Paenibacillus sp. MSt1 GN=nfi PE=3 SV=1: Endonuclease_5 [Tuwongella immobilis]